MISKSKLPKKVSTYKTVVKLNEFIHVKFLEQCLIHGEHSIYITYCHYYIIPYIIYDYTYYYIILYGRGIHNLRRPLGPPLSTPFSCFIE